MSEGSDSAITASPSTLADCIALFSVAQKRHSGSKIRAVEVGREGMFAMMRTILTSLGVILIGPFVGYFVTYWLYSIGSHNDCMWRLAAFGLSLTVGAPLGAVTCGAIGFCVGYRLDKQGKQQLSEHEDVESEDGAGTPLKSVLADRHPSE